MGWRKRVWCQLVFWFFSRLPEDVGFSRFFFHFAIAAFKFGLLAFTSPLLSASLAK